MAQITVTGSRWWLDYASWVVASHGIGTGRAGQWNRALSVGDMDETFAIFDFEAAGVTPGTSYSPGASFLRVSMTGSGVNMTAPLKVMRQNRTMRSLWNQPVWGARDPRLDDFPPVTEFWSEQLAISELVNANTAGANIDFFLGGNPQLKSAVDKWISKEWNPLDGIVLAANFAHSSTYLEITEVKFFFNTTGGGPDGAILSDYQQRRHR